MGSLQRHNMGSMTPPSVRHTISEDQKHEAPSGRRRAGDLSLWFAGGMTGADTNRQL